MGGDMWMPSVLRAASQRSFAESGNSNYQPGGAKVHQTSCNIEAFG